MNLLAQFMAPSKPVEEYSNLQFNPQNMSHGYDQGFMQQQTFHQQDQTPHLMNTQGQGNQMSQEIDPYSIGEPFLDPSVPTDAVRSIFLYLIVVLSRTVYVGNIKSEITQAQMIQIVESLTELRIESYVVRQI